jgi:hypothetical protein
MSRSLERPQERVLYQIVSIVGVPHQSPRDQASPGKVPPHQNIESRCVPGLDPKQERALFVPSLRLSQNGYQCLIHGQAARVIQANSGIGIS